MKKSILIFMLALGLSANSQTTFTNDVQVLKSSGIASLQVVTTDNTSFGVVAAKAGTTEVTLAAFGSNANISGPGSAYANNTAGVSLVCSEMWFVNEQPNGSFVIYTGGYGSASSRIRVATNGQVIIEANGSTHPLSPGGYLTLPANNGAPGNSPLYIYPGQLPATNEPNTLCTDSNGDLYWTNGTGVRTKLN